MNDSNFPEVDYDGIEKDYDFFQEYHIKETNILTERIRDLAKTLDKGREYEGYSWIKVKNFFYNKKKSRAENLKTLQSHHCDEILFLNQILMDFNTVV